MGEKKTSTSNEKTGKSREERLKAALKANLARRKVQSRARTQKDEIPGDTGQDKDA